VKERASAKMRLRTKGIKASIHSTYHEATMDEKRSRKVNDRELIKIR